jgi:hypothetical protein
VIKSILFTLVLLPISWIVSYGQVGKPNQDTIKCYGLTELRYIAASLQEGRVCDTVLQNSKVKLLNRNNTIKELDIQINLLAGQILIKDQILLIKESELKSVNLKLATAETQKKWLKIGWGSTTLLLTGFFVYIATIK